uniref:UPAR/Ly6 domain-containing protein n=1 Tax=Trichobilharzia regenti TaxID=157069 RepID=A0AA85JZT4_TRIRE|nr:unnamed protein product [Trichobilharzia regenti]
MAYEKMSLFPWLLLLLLSFTVKDVYSIKCYVCDNCLSVTDATTTSDTCGACVKAGVPDISIYRRCIDSCTGITSKIPARDILRCCTTELCNNAKKMKPFTTITLVVYVTWRMLISPIVN